MNLASRSKIIAIIVGAIIVAGVLLWYFLFFAPRPAPVAPNTAAAPEASSGGLGSEVYNKVSNPVGDKLPDAVAPVPNPIEGAYKNPFE